MILKARDFRFQFPRPTLIMGVVNVTPDSFSDGGECLDPKSAVRRALDFAQLGADILDIGGESTRPGAQAVSELEELRRVVSVVEALAGSVKIPISIDTRKPAVAQAALEAGASLVNDVAANRDSAEMWETVARARAGYVAMHMQGNPENMQEHPRYNDVAGEVENFFEDRLRRLAGAGVDLESVILDVGIGFGKTAEHNLQLLRALNRFTRFDRPLLLGVSRKSFLGKLTGAGVTERLPGALACACLAVEMGVRIVRTHDVAATVQAVRMTEAILGL